MMLNVDDNGRCRDGGGGWWLVVGGGGGWWLVVGGGGWWWWSWLFLFSLFIIFLDFMVMAIVKKININIGAKILMEK